MYLWGSAFTKIRRMSVKSLPAVAVFGFNQPVSILVFVTRAINMSHPYRLVYFVSDPFVGTRLLIAALIQDDDGNIERGRSTNLWNGLWILLVFMLSFSLVISHNPDNSREALWKNLAHA